MAEATRTRRQELRAAQRATAARQQRAHRIATWVGGAVVVALLLAIAAVVVHAARSGGSQPAGAVVTPAHTSATGAFDVGDPKAPVTLGVYYDYMCPACGAFEKANAQELDRLLDAGTVRIELRPISFLDRMSSGTRYSTRAASAFATVANGAPEATWDFHTALYAHQPQEGSSGLTDEQIADIAAQAGVPARVVRRLGDGTYEGWVAKVTQDAFDGGVKGTPTVEIDGARFTGDLFRTGPLTEAIEAAAKADPR